MTTLHTPQLRYEFPPAANADAHEVQITLSVQVRGVRLEEGQVVERGPWGGASTVYGAVPEPGWLIPGLVLLALFRRRKQWEERKRVEKHKWGSRW